MRSEKNSQTTELNIIELHVEFEPKMLINAM